MKSQSVKKLLLASLLIVAGYVWWGNLRLLFPEKRLAAPDLVFPTMDSNSARKTHKLQFMPPKVNPFRRWPRASESKAVQSAAVQAVPELLRSSHALVGVVNRGRSSQAIVLSPDGKRTVLTVGDSLNRWKLNEIKDKFVTFGQGKRSDTLWLGKRVR